MMNPVELEALIKSVKEIGLLEDIVLLEGQILDGRNRYKACLTAGVAPRTETYNPAVHGPSPVKFAAAKNLPRRHLSASEFAAAGAKILPLLQKEIQERMKAQKATPKTTVVKMPIKPNEAIPPGASGPAITKAGKKLPPASDDPKVEVVIPPNKGDSVVLGNGKSVVFTGKETQEQVVKKLVGIGFKPEHITFANPIEVGKDLSNEKTPEGKPKKKEWAAAEEAAKTVGVSTKSVKVAAWLQKHHPDLFEKVEKGEMTVNAAHKEGKARAAKLNEKQEIARNEALKKIQVVCGAGFTKAVKDGTLLKSHSELLEFSALPDDKMLLIKPYVEAHWPVKKALKFKATAVCLTHTVNDLIHRAIGQGNMLEVTFDGGWTLTLKKEVSHGKSKAA